MYEVRSIPDNTKLTEFTSLEEAKKYVRAHTTQSLGIKLPSGKWYNLLDDEDVAR